MHDANDDILCAKLHLVDFAGSERAKRTEADGLRLREGKITNQLTTDSIVENLC